MEIRIGCKSIKEAVEEQKSLREIGVHGMLVFKRHVYYVVYEQPDHTLAKAGADE